MAIRSHRAPGALRTFFILTTKGVTRVTANRRIVWRFATLGCIALALSTSGGCTIGTNAGKALMRHGCLDDFMVNYRNQALAAKAWHCRKEQYCHRGHLDEFQAGFYAGYQNIACGGTGCCPTIAPKEYWGWKYQSSDGQAGVNAWFEGFPAGVQAAETEGIGYWSEIRPAGLPVAPTGPMGQPIPADQPMYFEGQELGVPAQQMMNEPYLGDPGNSNGIMLEDGPQILMNGSDKGATTPTASVPGVIRRTSGTSDSSVSEDDLESSFGPSATSDSAKGATTSSSLPFTFK